MLDLGIAQRRRNASSCKDRTKIAGAAIGLSCSLVLGGNALAQSPAPPSEGEPPRVEAPGSQRLLHRIEALREQYGVPGLSVAVSSDKGFRAAEVAGIREVGHTAPVEVSDAFLIASITKPMLGTLAGALVDAGLMSWDTTPADVWPDRMGSMHSDLRRVTLAQLLSHRAGLAGFLEDEDLASAPPASGTPVETRKAFAFWLLEQPPAGPVGAYAYSNADYALAGAMMEAQLGESWDSLMRRLVFEPLAMTTCGFGLPAINGGHVAGHRATTTGYVSEGSKSDDAIPWTIAPAGDIHCSATDLVRFGEAHLLGLQGRHPLLKPETFARIHDAPVDEYGLGWNIQSVGSTHLGGTYTFHGALMVHRQRNLVIGVLLNTWKEGETGRLLTDVIRAAMATF